MVAKLDSGSIRLFGRSEHPASCPGDNAWLVPRHDSFEVLRIKHAESLPHKSNEVGRIPGRITAKVCHNFLKPAISIET
jgi:hypothetical protein